MQRWTEEEKKILREMYTSGKTYDEIADVLDRTYQSVKAAREYNLIALNPPNLWTIEDDTKLKRLWRTDMHPREIASELGRTYKAVLYRSKTLGIKKGKFQRRGGANDWTDKETETLKRLWLKDGLTSGAIAKILNRPRNAVMGKLNRLKLKSPTGVKHKISRVYRKRKPYVVKPKPAKEVVKKKASRYDVPFPISLKVSIVDAGPKDCRYMEGEISEGCCGHEVMEGKSFCPAHQNLCYYVPDPKKRKF